MLFSSVEFVELLIILAIVLLLSLFHKMVGFTLDLRLCYRESNACSSACHVVMKVVVSFLLEW